MLSTRPVVRASAELITNPETPTFNTSCQDRVVKPSTRNLSVQIPGEQRRRYFECSYCSDNEVRLLLKYDGCELSTIALIRASFGSGTVVNLTTSWLALTLFQPLTVASTTSFVSTESFFERSKMNKNETSGRSVMKTILIQAPPSAPGECSILEYKVGRMKKK